ncbi:MAG: endopeptidase La [Deltaproteobacteria bacterium]|nr:MAG: endopeptidase La [Deltaproteobacteria bacterium]
MEEKLEGEQIVIPDILPLLPVRDVVIFPYMILPLFVNREMSIRAVDEALSKDRLIFLAAQKNIEEEEPAPEGIYSVGTVATIMRMLKLPDGRVKILIQGLIKSRVVEYTEQKTIYIVRTEQIKEPEISDITLEVEALMRNIKEQLEKMVSVGKIVSPDLLMVIENVKDPGRLADLIASNLGLRVEDAQQILETIEPIARLTKLNEFLNKELEVLTMQAKIQSQAKEEINKSQREYFLREQLRAIKSELGESDEKTREIEEFREKIKKAKMPKEAEDESNKQLSRLEQMHPDAAEASMVRTYLDWLTELPWSKSTKDRLDIKKAKEVLDEDHYDLEKIKERILEYLAVGKLKKRLRGPILCFVGPPGVGKTSLGKSIARSLGRKFVRISLGGLRDEAEIRGHRRTYVGALPGRIIQGIKQAGTNNPVFMMDEVDKIGMDFRGDPAAALLEVLDPEQNYSFSDHYLNLPFDLSNVMFITTANLIDPVPSALKDRMEVIRLSGYSEQEKLQIARQFLIPRQLEENGLGEKDLQFTNQSILQIITQYTKEAGLRNLEREIASVCRKVARSIAEGGRGPFRITQLSLSKYLGPPKYLPESEQEADEVGLATGLAWTETGGEILYVEVSVMKGTGKLTLTGHMGDVMKESAQASLSYARSRAKQFDIDPDFFKKIDIHIHVPAGAIPKDGPSAGVTMATALISALSKTPVRKDVAMTGEITLRGKVLPVGGLKEKSLAALQAKIKTVVIPKDNRKDLEEIPRSLRRRLNFLPAGHMDEIISTALKKNKKKRTSLKKVG